MSSFYWADRALSPPPPEALENRELLHEHGRDGEARRRTIIKFAELFYAKFPAELRRMVYRHLLSAHSDVRRVGQNPMDYESRLPDQPGANLPVSPEVPSTCPAWFFSVPLMRDVAVEILQLYYHTRVMAVSDEMVPKLRLVNDYGYQPMHYIRELFIKHKVLDSIPPLEKEVFYDYGARFGRRQNTGEMDHWTYEYGRFGQRDRRHRRLWTILAELPCLEELTFDMGSHHKPIFSYEWRMFSPIFMLLQRRGVKVRVVTTRPWVHIPWTAIFVIDTIKDQEQGHGQELVEIDSEFEPRFEKKVIVEKFKELVGYGEKYHEDYVYRQDDHPGIPQNSKPYSRENQKKMWSLNKYLRDHYEECVKLWGFGEKEWAEGIAYRGMES